MSWTRNTKGLCLYVFTSVNMEGVKKEAVSVRDSSLTWGRGKLIKKNFKKSSSTCVSTCTNHMDLIMCLSANRRAGHSRHQELTCVTFTQYISMHSPLICRWQNCNTWHASAWLQSLLLLKQLTSVIGSELHAWTSRIRWQRLAALEPTAWWADQLT